MFRTEIEDLKIPLSIDHKDQLITLGSCFSDTIGQRLVSNKFRVQVNPFGTIFNPLSIFELLDFSIEPSVVIENAVLKRDGMFYNYKLPSSFRAKTEHDLLKNVSVQLEKTQEDLSKAKVIMLTFGTAWVYQLKDSQMLVANCHKQPQKRFNKYLLTVEEIVTGFMGVKEKLELINPDVQVLLTVSPVRHTRETLSLNNTSKSVLKLASHYLSEMADNVHYFPSYEILQDDLRDYRFYEKDLIHPNEQAIDYIWDIFVKTFCVSNTKKTLREWQKVSRALSHRSFNPESDKHHKFLQKTLDKLYKLNHHLDVKDEINGVKQQMKSNGQ